MLLHLADELERVGDVALDDAAGDEGVLGDDVRELDRAEDPASDVRLSEACVHVHERVLHEPVARHAAFYHVPMHGLLVANALERAHAHCGLARHEAGLGLHLREQPQRLLVHAAN